MQLKKMMGNPIFFMLTSPSADSHEFTRIKIFLGSFCECFCILLPVYPSYCQGVGRYQMEVPKSTLALVKRFVKFAKIFNDKGQLVRKSFVNSPFPITTLREQTFHP